MTPVKLGHLERLAAQSFFHGDDDVGRLILATVAELQAQREALGAAVTVVKRLLYYVELHEQAHPEWNGNRFDDQRLAEKWLQEVEK